MVECAGLERASGGGKRRRRFDSTQTRELRRRNQGLFLEFGGSLKCPRARVNGPWVYPAASDFLLLRGFGLLAASLARSLTRFR